MPLTKALKSLNRHLTQLILPIGGWSPVSYCCRPYALDPPSLLSCLQRGIPWAVPQGGIQRLAPPPAYALGGVSPRDLPRFENGRPNDGSNEDSRTVRCHHSWLQPELAEAFAQVNPPQPHKRHHKWTNGWCGNGSAGG